MIMFTDRLQGELARLSSPPSGLEATISEQFESWVAMPLGQVDAPVDQDKLIDQMIFNLIHYQLWHERGPQDGGDCGLVTLHREAIRIAGDISRGTEAATETYLDVRERLRDCVDRALRQRPIPDFRQPLPDGRENVHRYHRIQARLRIQGRWRQRKTLLPLEDEKIEGAWEKDLHRAETQTYAIPLHFAAMWYHIDVRPRRTRDGREKNRSWWWRALEHALNLEQIQFSRADRNDPGEAALRLQVRFAAACGLSRWLRRWSEDKPYWKQAHFGLPDPKHPVARPAVESALNQLRPALIEGIQSMKLGDKESKALHGILTRGDNVRTAIRHFSGETTADRRERMLALAEEAGLMAEKTLNTTDHDNDRGEMIRCPETSRALMRQMRSGKATLSASKMRQVQRHIAECEGCQMLWAGMVEAGPYIDAIVAQEQVARQPQRRPWLALGVGALAVALVLFLILPRTEAPNRYRGSEGQLKVLVDLSVQRVGAERAVRFSQIETYAVGDRVFFQLSTKQGAGRVRVWIQGPDNQLVEIDRTDVDPNPRWLGDGEVAWRFEQSGQYRIFAAPEGDETCIPERCTTLTIKVEDP
ncbi:MAG: hypothetical protein AAFV53_28210 [Myxococcota bacterium]